MSVASESKNKSKIISQKEYEETPYEATSWEVIGEFSQDPFFEALECQIVASDPGFSDEMFEDFGKKIPKNVETARHSPKPFLPRGSKAEEESSPAFDIALFEKELKQKFEEGLKQGREEGHQVAQAEAAERYEALSKRVNEVMSSMTEQTQEAIGSLEKKALEFSVSVAKKILQATAEARPEYIVEVIREGLRRIGASKPLRIRVSMQDLEFLEVVGLPAELSGEELGVEYIGDETIKSGCVIETDFGQVDLELDAMWEQVNAELFEVYK